MEQLSPAIAANGLSQGLAIAAPGRVAALPVAAGAFAEATAKGVLMTKGSNSMTVHIST